MADSITQTSDCCVPSADNKALVHEQIAEMKKAREADERTRIMLDSTPLVAHFWDENYELVDCNNASFKMFGLSSKQEYIDRYFELTPEFQPDGTNSEEGIKKLIDKAFREGNHKVEWMRRLPSGEELPVELTLVRVDYRGKNLVAGYCRDLREHKRMIRELKDTASELKDALEKSEHRLIKLNLTAHAAKIGFWDMEIIRDDPLCPSNVFTWSNEFRYMLGYMDENDFPNILSSWSDLIHPDEKEAVLVAFENHLMDLSGKTPYDIEYRMFMKNGESGYFHDSGETMRDESGNPLRVAGALLDITESKNLILEAEKQRAAAEAANKAKSMFLSTMSHEIRTPMNAILGIAEIQLQNDALDPDVRESIEKIYSSGDLLLSIINDILDLSKIEAGRLDLVIDNYEVASLLCDTAQLNMMRIGSKPVEFELHVDENMPSLLMGDELRVKLILNNLLSNAFKYTEEGTVKLLASSEASEGNEDEVILVFSVYDTGIGMTKEQVDNLFDEYARFSSEYNRMTEGTGLGMSITRNLLSLMNGEISVVSEPGAGSAFTVRLPQGRSSQTVLGRDVADNLKQFRTHSRSQMKRVRVTREPMPYGSVLVVDDVETNIFVAKGLFAPYELAVDSTYSGYSAIEKIRKGEIYDVIFMDHMMPQMDGIEATKRIRALGYDRPIVALTANAVSGQSEIFLSNGFNDFISKPIDIRQLNKVLNRLVRDRHPEEALEVAKQRRDRHVDGAPEDMGAAQAVDPQTVEAFMRDSRRALEALEFFVAKGNPNRESDIRAFVIQVHGMKGALANVGNVELSVEARRLEQLGRARNTEMILSRAPAFIKALKVFMNEISPEDDSDGSERDVSEEDWLMLREDLGAIRAACKDYDGYLADATLSKLRKTAWPRKQKELLESISELILHSDFEDTVSAIDKFLEKSE